MGTMDGAFNPATGEFNVENKKITEVNEKIMMTKDGRRVSLYEDGKIFDPSMGEFVDNIKPEDLEEIK